MEIERNSGPDPNPFIKGWISIKMKWILSKVSECTWKL